MPAVVVALVALGVVVVGCTATEPTPSGTATTSAVATSEPAASPTEEPAPTLVPDGTADENLPFFAQIVQDVWAGPDSVSGRAYIDALSSAGFDKGSMQVTQDMTTVGNAAESIQFSVLIGEDCLVGQVGPATGQAVTVVLPVLGTGTCLLGDTRPIDW
nr:hypothetical protein [Microbacterium endophyticum]